MARISSGEERVLRFVANQFQTNAIPFQASEVHERLGMNQQQLMVCVRRIAHLDAASITELGDDISVTPLPASVDLVREIDDRRHQEATTRPDIVADFKRWVKAQPLLAWPLIVILSAGSLLALANQIWAFIDKLRDALN